MWSFTLSLSIFHSTLHGILRHDWTGALKCNFDMWMNYRHRYTRMLIIPTLAASFEAFAHHRNVTSLNVLMYCFQIRSSKLTEVIIFFILVRGPLFLYILGCIIFLLPFELVTRMSTPSVSSTLNWNSLPAVCFLWFVL